MVKNLNPDQMRKLRDRRNLRPADRANVDYKMAKKVRSGLDGLAGLLYIMKALPAKKLKPSDKREDGLKDTHVRLLLDLTETALKILDYKKVRGTADDLYILDEKNKKTVEVNWTTGEAIRRGEFYRAKPKQKDIDRAILLWKHVDYLKQKFVPEINIESPSIVQLFTIEDCIDEQMWQEEEEKIKQLLASGVKDIEQIAREVGRDSWDVWQTVYRIQETEREIKRRIERREQDISKLEHDTTAIGRIRELWANSVHPIAIAVDINHPVEAVREIINKMAMEPLV